MNATYKLSPEALPKAWINVIRESARAAEGDRYNTVAEGNVEVPAVVCGRCGAQLVAAGPLRVSCVFIWHTAYGEWEEPELGTSLAVGIWPADGHSVYSARRVGAAIG